MGRTNIDILNPYPMNHAKFLLWNETGGSLICGTWCLLRPEACRHTFGGCGKQSRLLKNSARNRTLDRYPQILWRRRRCACNLRSNSRRWLFARASPASRHISNSTLHLNNYNRLYLHHYNNVFVCTPHLLYASLPCKYFSRHRGKKRNCTLS